METTLLSHAQLVSKWNTKLVPEAQSVGINEVGLKRVEALESRIRAREASERAVAQETPTVTAPVEATAETGPEQEDDVARKTKRKRSPRQSHANGTSLQAKWDTWNELAVEGKKLGIPYAKKHTSAWSSHDSADKRIKQLKADIARARAR
jgi:hypothetical protein